MTETTHTDSPTVVLVHGAFADSSSWNGVIERLQAKGVPVVALANPLRGLRSDSDYVAARLRELPGPVVAVGHSYGGAVITNAAGEADNVVGLVYVAAFAPDEGETLGAATAASKDAVLGSVLVPHRYPAATGDEAVEFTIDPEGFRDAFAADLPDETTVVLAATQRPVAELAFSEPTESAAWRNLPSHAIVPAPDKAAGTDVLRSMAERAGASITEVEGSHLIMVSRPELVAGVILEAVDAAGRRTAAVV
jgi:pimeloyl-ACP methyl ester carboxylesterase